MSSEIPPEKRAAALNDRLYAAFNDGLELIAIQVGYRFGWYSALAQHVHHAIGESRLLNQLP